jgi:hypothetical protein
MRACTLQLLAESAGLRYFTTVVYRGTVDTW